MKRIHLEHLIRASASVSDDDELIVIGSQAVLGQFPDAPQEMLVSMEADLYPVHHPDRADLIDGSIGEGSPFHDTFGYYAQGVGPTTAILPEGWQKRLIPLRTANTAGATGWCLEIHDLVVSKLVAGREKDLAFARAALLHALVNGKTLKSRARALPVADDMRQIVLKRIDGASTGGFPHLPAG